ncbi:MAG TPA: right-handed parallel beta-helix repeat-containing protein [Saprospiraceae bacterium]|nr:right-handed parallel beta-helix repeat-containing protein [Saprospiraceae bacterium]HMQ83522.1 right-handed parallel beta-helix repeat-containing protein [Saprospiraceae bacterium]
MKNFFFLFAGFCLFFGIACDQDDNFITGTGVNLEFSLDTLRFDTVFTEIGSATQSFKVYNRSKNPVRIDKIMIEGNENGRFRMNVDGFKDNTADKAIRNVEIWGNDSIYVFVEVTIDPDQPLSISPFVIEDKVVFESGEKKQEVRLEAWGQNANYFPSRFNRGVPVVLSCNNETIVWDDPKPYVIYGEIFIDSCLLEVHPGTRIHVHGGIAKNEVFGIFNDGIIYTLEAGSIQFKGTQEAPIVVEGDRLEENFLEQPGQWQGIIIGKGSQNNSMEYTTVKNAIFAVYVDSMGEFTARNSRFYNTNSSGIIGFHGKIDLENCLVYNNESNSLQVIQGGDYTFQYCTFASYGVDASAVGLTNFFCYDGLPPCEYLGTYRVNAFFQNCILFGSRNDELFFSDISQGAEPGLFNVTFDHCIVKVDKLLTETGGLYSDFFETRCFNCINASRTDALFADVSEDDYRLDTLSVAEGKALPLPGILIDLEGYTRDAQMPDVGCYEYQY